MAGLDSESFDQRQARQPRGDRGSSNDGCSHLPPSSPPSSCCPPPCCPCWCYPCRCQHQHCCRHCRIVIIVAGGITLPSCPRILFSSCCASWLLRVASVTLWSHRLVVACRVASVTISSCAALLSFRSVSWLLRVAHLCCLIWLHHPLASCSLVMPASCCMSRYICCPILLHHPLILLLLAMPLSFYHVVLPSCPLVAPGGCCVSLLVVACLSCPWASWGG